MAGVPRRGVGGWHTLVDQRDAQAVPEGSVRRGLSGCPPSGGPRGPALGQEAVIDSAMIQANASMT